MEGLSNGTTSLSRLDLRQFRFPKCVLRKVSRCEEAKSATPLRPHPRRPGRMGWTGALSLVAAAFLGSTTTLVSGRFKRSL